MKIHTSYLLCCTPRTGSWLLAEGLERVKLAGQPREYFESRNELGWLEKWSMSTFATHADYLNKVLEVGTTPNGVFGGKVHLAQLEDLVFRLRLWPDYENLGVAEIMGRIFPNLHYVWITRRDKVRQAISYYKASKTGIWFKTNSRIADKEPAFVKMPEFDFVAISNLVKWITLQENIWQHYFAICAVEPFVVVYEDLVPTYRPTIMQILRYLHIEIPEDLVIPIPRLQKQADTITDVWVQQYYQLEQGQEVTRS